MKKVLHVVLGGSEFIASWVFFAHAASDIQLGFGLVFLFAGFQSILEAVQ